MFKRNPRCTLIKPRSIACKSDKNADNAVNLTTSENYLPVLLTAKKEAALIIAFFGPS